MTTPRFEQATPVLPSSDYPRSRRFYCDVLGFQVTEEAGEPPAFGIFERGSCVLFVDGFRGAPRRDSGDHGWGAHFRMSGLDGFVSEIGQRGATLDRGITTTNYGMREVEIVDPDGNRLCFGEDTSPPPRIVRNHYVLAVHDLERSRAWYEQVLGCRSEDVDAGNWVFCRTGDPGVLFMIGRCPDAIAPADLGDHSYFAYLVIQNLDEWFARAKSAGAKLIKQPTRESWGMREFGLRTVDGHRIMLGEPE